MDKRILDFVRLRLHQLALNLNVYRELGPAYQHEVDITTAIIAELRGIETAIETFIAVEEYANTNTPG